MVPSWYRYRRTIDADTQQKQVSCTDYFSKWPEAQSLPSKCAEGGPKFVLSLITRLKNESGKILKKKYNSAQLNKGKNIQLLVLTCIEGQGGTDTDFQTERGKESSAHEIHVLNDQLYSSSLLRLWRTGADELAYEAAEDPTAFNLEVDEYALSVALDNLTITNQSQPLTNGITTVFEDNMGANGNSHRPEGGTMK
ncbi:hypothetical protein EMCRGX_G006207 [Ephydatia muelleri]